MRLGDSIWRVCTYRLMRMPMGIKRLHRQIATGVMLGLFCFALCALPDVVHADQTLHAPTVHRSIFDRIFAQIHGVTAFTAEAISSVLSLHTKTSAQNTATTTNQLSVAGAAPSALHNVFVPSAPITDSGTLLVNVPFAVHDQFTVTGDTSLNATTIHNLLRVQGDAELSSLSVAQTISAGGVTISGPLRVSGLSHLQTLTVNGKAAVTGALRATGGIMTEDANIDAGTGKIFASNIVNGIRAGDNISIEGPSSSPIISAKMPHIPHDDLARVRSRGGCSDCIVDGDVSSVLTITDGTINDTPIGLSTPSNAAFTDVSVGTSTATSTLSVNGSFNLLGQLTVSSTATSTFNNSVNIIGGCVAVNGVCLGGGVSSLDDLSDVSLASTTYGDFLQFDGARWQNVASTSLGLGNGTYVGLRDTPSAFLAAAVPYTNAAGNALTQSTNLVFDGNKLGVGTSSPLDTLSVSGQMGLLNDSVLRFYNPNNSAYVGFRASSSIASSTVWNLPTQDGTNNQILVTDGSGNLRFDTVSSIGGGVSTYLDLTDTPSAYVNKAIPYVNGSALAFSGGFVYDGSHLGIGTNAPSTELSVTGSAQFHSSTSTVGFLYDKSTNRVGIGTINPTNVLTVEGGSVTQRGAASGNTYRPKQLGSLNMPDNATDVFIAGAYAYVTTAGSGKDFHVVNVSDAGTPVEVGSLSLVTGANAVYVSGQYAYVTTDVSGDDLQIIDISDPKNPTLVGSVNLSTTATDVVVHGNYAYVTTAGTGDDVHVIDISDTTSPEEVGSLNLPDAANAIDVRGDYAYVVTNVLGDGMYVIDIADPTAPTITGSVVLPAATNDLVVQGQYAYAVSDSAGDDFHVIDISNPSSPSVVGSIDLVTGANAVSIAGRYAYVATNGTGDDFHVIDVSDSTAPIEVGSEDLSSGVALSVAIAGMHAYVTTSAVGDDLHIMDITGVETQAAFVDSLQAGTISTLDGLRVAGEAVLGNGLRVGGSGIQTDGSLYVQGSENSFVNGNLGIGTTTPGAQLTVAGDAHISGALRDASNSAGSNGAVLTSTGSGLQWVATSSLGIGGGGGGSSYWTQSGSDIHYSTGNVGIGTASPNATLSVYGNGLFVGTNRYLNFGTATGSSGYGIRDNGGTLQFKNSAGTWQGLGTGSGGGAATSSASGIGMVSAFPTASCPSGWLPADGSTVSRSMYADLYSEIGTTYGNGDGSTTFNLPDLRGEFIRGWDDGRGVDSGRTIGSSQLDQMQRITGSFYSSETYPTDAIGAFSTGSVQAGNRSSGSSGGRSLKFDSADSPGARTGVETRPRNLALNYCISYRGSVSGSIFTAAGTNAYYTTGNVGLGTSAPSARLDVVAASGLYNGVRVKASNGSFGPSVSAVQIAYQGGGSGFGISLRPAIDSTYPLVFTNAAGTQVGSVFTSGSNTTFNTASDRRLKENIATTTLGLDTLMQIPVRDFDFKSDPSNTHQQGFIAQELNKFYPYAVTTNGDNGIDLLSATATPWQVDYGRLTPLIVRSIQQLRDQVAAIQSLYEKITALAGKVAAFANSITTKTLTANTVCVKRSDDSKVCVTGDELSSLLSDQGISPAQQPRGTTTASSSSNQTDQGSSAETSIQETSTTTTSSTTQRTDTASASTTSTSNTGSTNATSSQTSAISISSAANAATSATGTQSQQDTTTFSGQTSSSQDTTQEASSTPDGSSSATDAGQNANGPDAGVSSTDENDTTTTNASSTSS